MNCLYENLNIIPIYLGRSFIAKRWIWTVNQCVAGTEREAEVSSLVSQLPPSPVLLLPTRSFARMLCISRAVSRRESRELRDSATCITSVSKESHTRTQMQLPWESGCQNSQPFLSLWGCAEQPCGRNGSYFFSGWILFCCHHSCTTVSLSLC